MALDALIFHPYSEKCCVCFGALSPLPQAAFWSSFSSHSDCDRIHSPASPAPETHCQILHHQQKWAGQSCLLPVFCHNLCFLQINSGFMIPDYTEHFACNKQEYIEDFSVELGGESLGWGTMSSFQLGWAFSPCAAPALQSPAGMEPCCISGRGTEHKDSGAGTVGVPLELGKAARWTETRWE